jgi:signal transduction histidine kinase
MEQLFQIDKCFSKGISKDNVLYGNLSIVTLKSQKIFDMELVNTFLTQASIGIERNNLQNELLKSKESAEEMNRIKTIFLANMSHELRTPLNGILGFSELLLEQIEVQHQNDMVGIIHNSGIRLLETLNTILDFTTLDSKNESLTYKNENIVSIIREVVRIHSADAVKKSLSVIYTPSAENISGYIAGNILHKIVHNLLSNAVKFTNNGTISISIKEKVEKTSRWIVVNVKDTGIGIPASEQEYIFREFRQGSEGFTRKYEGTGLGLTISKKFTVLLGGEISVKSTPGKGSDFCLKLPVFDLNPNEHK